MDIRIKLNGRILKAETQPWLVRRFPSGAQQATAFLPDGRSYRVERRDPKKTFFTVVGRPR